MESISIKSTVVKFYQHKALIGSITSSEIRVIKKEKKKKTGDHLRNKAIPIRNKLNVPCWYIGPIRTRTGIKRQNWPKEIYN